MLIKSVMEKRNSELITSLRIKKIKAIEDFFRAESGNEYPVSNFSSEVKEFSDDEFLKLLNSTKIPGLHRGNVAFIHVTEKGERSFSDEDTAEIVMVNIREKKTTFICKQSTPVQDESDEYEMDNEAYEQEMEFEFEDENRLSR